MTQTTVGRREGVDATRTTARRQPRTPRPMPADGIWGWLGPIIVGAIAAALRLVELGRPHRIIFDETYYAKDALSQLRYGYARKAIDDADEMIVEGKSDVFLDEPSFVVHPPVGKFLIGQGIRLLGMEPAGWRLATALAGVVTVILVARAGRRLFRSTVLGCAAGLLLAVDGLSIAVSRTAILDGILAMFVVAAFACLLVDRDRSRAALTDWAQRRSAAGLPLGDGPVIVWRPWRLAAGIMLGLACGTKWSGIYVVAVFGLMTVLWEISARRAVGISSPGLNATLRDGPVAFVTIVGSALVTYVVSWWGWIFSDDGWGRQWSADNAASTLGSLMPDWVRSLWHYHGDILRFHQDLSEPHTYESTAWTWLFLGRPVSFDYQGLEHGEMGCEVERCSQEVLALGNPILWWGGCAALVVCLVFWFLRRDWRPGAILAGIVATWVPWLFYLDRTTFAFYAAAIAPFIALAVAYTLGLVLGRPGDPPHRRAVGAALAGAFVLVAIVVAAWFYPIHVDEVIPYDEWRKRMWFESWI